MKTLSVQIKDPEGLHARNSVRISMAVRKMDARVSLCVKEQLAVADQILEIMSLEAMCGDWVEIRAEGREEQAALEAVRDILQEIAI